MTTVLLKYIDNLDTHVWSKVSKAADKTKQRYDKP